MRKRNGKCRKKANYSISLLKNNTFISTIIIIAIVYICSIGFLAAITLKSIKIDKDDKTSLKVKVLGIIICIAMAPILVIVRIIIFFKNKEYAERPRPVPPRMRMLLRKDIVLDGKDTCSIAEYNAKHNTNFTLQDVYGKKYVQGITEEEKNHFDDYKDKVSVAKDLPDGIYAKVCKTFVEARAKNDYTEFLKYLADNVVFVLYKKDTIIGKEGFIRYWQDLWKRKEIDRLVYKTEVRKCIYYNRTAVYDQPHGYKGMYLLFLISNNKVTHAVYAPNPLQEYSLIRYCDLDSKPFSTIILTNNLGEDLEPQANRIPCLRCGTLSEKMQWYRSKSQRVDLIYYGELSICPNCMEQVEFCPDSMARLDMSQVNKNELDPDDFTTNSFPECD